MVKSTVVFDGIKEKPRKTLNNNFFNIAIFISTFFPHFLKKEQYNNIVITALLFYIH